MDIKISWFKDENWAQEVVYILNDLIDNYCLKAGACRLMLTGGRSAQKVYTSWAKSIDTLKGRVEIFYTDERCVPEDHFDSNHYLVMNTLFNMNLPSNFSINNYDGEKMNISDEIIRYSEKLKTEIDILIVSVANDGHICSIFPYDLKVHNSGNLVEWISNKQHPYSRFSITPKVISSAKTIFCLANGLDKGKLLKRCIEAPLKSLELPARLILRGHWLLDESAYLAFLNSKRNK